MKTIYAVTYLSNSNDRNCSSILFELFFRAVYFEASPRYDFASDGKNLMMFFVKPLQNSKKKEDKIEASVIHSLYLRLCDKYSWQRINLPYATLYSFRQRVDIATNQDKLIACLLYLHYHISQFPTVE